MVAAPLWLRVPIEYGIVVAATVIVAWVYASFANADLVLAFGIGLGFFITSTLVTYVLAKRKGYMLHPVTYVLLAFTAAWALGFLKVL